MNKWIGTGRIGKKPELRKTQTGKSVCNVGIAVNRMPINGQEQQHVWVSIVAWNQSAEYVCRYGNVGDTLLIEGRLESRKYTDRDGSERTVTEIVADHVELFKKSGNQNEQQAEYQSNNQAQQNAMHENFNTGPSIDIGPEDLPF